MGLDRAATLHVDLLSDATTDLEKIGAQAQSALADSRDAFAWLYETLNPEVVAIGNIQELIQAFIAEKHPLHDFGRLNMTSGIESAFTMGLAHGEVSETALQRVSSSMPQKANGSKVSLRSFGKLAKKYAGALVETRKL